MLHRQSGDVDYSTPLCLPDQRKGVPNTPDGGQNALIERVVPSFVREIGKSAGPCGAHCVDKRIYFSPAVRNQCERTGHLSIIRGICCDGEHVRSSGVANLWNCLIEDF
jgi:hypothetical protein